MATLKDIGFKPARVAVKGDYEIALGTVNTGQIVISASTPLGEGYTSYLDAHEATVAYDTIVNKMNLVSL